jgi:hypothetical protein
MAVFSLSLRKFVWKKLERFGMVMLDGIQVKLEKR